VPITALVATIRGWPAARKAITLIAAQLFPAGGEFIVVDGSSNPAPSEDELIDAGGPIQWKSMPGKSVFQLRLAGYRAARGHVVAITEDHCYVEPDWIERILAAHQAFPSAGAVGGAVLNNTDQKLVDWAAFFLTQAPYMPPLENGVAARISGPANVSYKRRVLERIGGDDAQGVIDFLELPAALQGEDLVSDDSIRVRHNQSQGVLGTSLAEFDNGRTIAGYRRRQMTRGDWLRIASSPVLPAYRAVRQMRIVRSKESPPGMTRRRIAAVLPAHVWFQYCGMAGELLGYAAGPGDSPKRLY
jgi:glycosyltransferase involved in cell wall biosynthesis